MTKPKQFIDFLKRHPVLLFWLVFLVNFVLRIFYTDYSSIYLDEGQTMFQVKREVGTIVNDYVKKQQNAPLYFLILHYWVGIFGLSVFKVRAFSVLMMALTGAMVFHLGRKLRNLEFAMAASILFLGVNDFMNFAHEARGYALIAFLAVTSFYFLLRLLSTGKYVFAIGLFTMNIALLFTHYLTIYIFPVEFIVAVFYWILTRERKPFLTYVLSQAAVVLCFLPWLSVVLAVMPEKGSFWIPVPTWNIYLNSMYYLVMSKSRTHWILSLMAVALLIWVIRFKKNDPILNTFIFCTFLWGFLPNFANYVVGQYVPVFVRKYTFYSSFGFLLFFANALFILPVGQVVRWLFIGYCSVVSFKKLNWKSPKMEDWKGAVEFIKTDNTTQSRPIFVQTDYAYKGFLPYYDLDLFSASDKPYVGSEADNVFFGGTFAEFERTLRKHDLKSLVLVRAHWKSGDSQGEIKKWLDENWQLKKEEPSYQNIEIYFYEKP